MRRGLFYIKPTKKLKLLQPHFGSCLLTLSSGLVTILSASFSTGTLTEASELKIEAPTGFTVDKSLASDSSFLKIASAIALISGLNMRIQSNFLKKSRVSFSPQKASY